MRRACLLFVITLSFIFPAIVSAAELKVHRLFGPESPGRYKHPASITQLDSGDFYLVYYGGSGEYGADTAVYGSRRKRGSSDWSPPKVIADTPGRSEGNAVVWQAPDGKIWLFYLTRYGKTWSTSRIKAKLSIDGAHTWSDPLMLAFELGMMVRAHPIVLADGDYLLPVYHETGNDRELVGDDSTSLFLRYHRATGVWSETNRIHARLGCIQPAVAAINDKDLVCYCRRGGGYEPRNDGWLVRSQSHDGGRTWTAGKETKFPNPNAAVDFIRLQNGHLLLVYNDSMNDRTPLCVAISTDDDKSYSYRRNIAEGKGSFAYPTAIQAHDGKIHVIFTSHDRTVINEAVFDEAWVPQAKPAGRSTGP